MADTVESLQKRVKELDASLAKAHERRREEGEDLRTDLHIAQDEATAQRQRAELAEERLHRIRDVLGRDQQAAAHTLVTRWDIERKRRSRHG